MKVVGITDVDGITQAILGFSPTELHAKLRQAAESVRTYWADLAKDRLHTTAAAYEQALRVIDVAPLHVAVVLDGKFANMLEQGAPPWDLRLTVLQSDKAKTSKDGYLYLSVPFEHSTPGTAGRRGAVMPKAIHDAASKLRVTVSGVDAGAAIAEAAKHDPRLAAHHARRAMRSAKQTLWGGIAGVMPGTGGRLPAGLAPKAQDYHATDKFAGMYKMAKDYARGAGFVYLTFRTISTNPNARRDADGNNPAETGKPTANWIHPGFPGLNLVLDAARWAETDGIPAALIGPATP